MVPHAERIELLCPESAEALDDARAILRDYAATLDVSQCWTDLAPELRGLPGEYGEPRGQLLLALVDGVVAGCCAIRPLDHVDYADACEMRRLYVSPQYRGLGVGRSLAQAQLDFAQLKGYRCVLLDTLSDMEAARALYEELGFEEIPPYYFNPIAGAHYLKADL
jgi:ribosomal protein S18 acetylase RimI-like enzyme